MTSAKTGNKDIDPAHLRYFQTSGGWRGLSNGSVLLNGRANSICKHFQKQNLKIPQVIQAIQTEANAAHMVSMIERWN